MAHPPDPLSDQGTVAERYEAAWRRSLFTRADPPRRETWLQGAGAARASLEVVLVDIDRAYQRIVELIRSGALSPPAESTTDLLPREAAQRAASASPDQPAPTVDLVPPVAAPEAIDGAVEAGETREFSAVPVPPEFAPTCSFESSPSAQPTAEFLPRDPAEGEASAPSSGQPAPAVDLPSPVAAPEADDGSTEAGETGEFSDVPVSPEFGPSVSFSTKAPTEESPGEHTDGAGPPARAQTVFISETPPVGMTTDGGAAVARADRTEELPAARSAPRPDLGQGADIGGYRVLGVIARGGMGVVYKARHVHLERLAAIKMILAGGHTSHTQLIRFRDEAQVIAGLQHPNIVQLFEVGEHNGLPYIALEYVDGGSLGHHAGGQPQSPREAAALTEVIARAVDFSHQQGVIHRDLKPANVLLTAAGVPKVTDFGLAKRLEAGSSQTRDGTVMGTPSYMAPEQAAGQTQRIGPHTDVYGLGAILYELLTGVPPHARGTPVETLVAVLKQEPLPPRGFQESVPRDLETICLKCLAKEPERRYVSAAALAEDLRRFLAGEPVSARPVGRTERLYRWCRRNPGIAALSAMVFVLLTTVAVMSTAATVRIRAEKRAAESSAFQARAAQAAAESARREAERLKATAEGNAARARAAQRKADRLATVAAGQRELALEALGGLIMQVQNRLDDAPGTQRVKQELLKLALDGLKKIADRKDDAGVVDIRMAEGHRRLGELAERLGDLKLARRSYKRVHAISRQQTEADPENPDWKRALSVAVAKLGDLATVSGDLPSARRDYQACLRLREELAESRKPAAMVDLAQIYVKLGNISEPARAVELYRRGLQIRERILLGSPRKPNARRDVRVSHSKLADGLLKAGEPDRAREHAAEAVRLARGLVNDYPRIPRLKLDLAAAHAKLGDTFRGEDLREEAAREYQTAVGLIEPPAKSNPRDLVLQTTYALFLTHAGRHADGAAVAGRVRQQAADNPFLLYNLACVFAVAVESAGDAPESERAELARAYGEASLGCLQAALDAGFADHDLIREDPELAAARQLPGFAAVAERLRESTSTDR